MSSNVKVDKWTDSEKELLFSALTLHGSSDLNKLHEEVSTKSASSIARLLQHYELLAEQELCNDSLYNFEFISREQKNLTDHNGIPLSMWVKALNESSSSKSSIEALSVALRLIALLEDHPNPNEMHDFKQLYLFLSCLLSGKTPPALSYQSEEFLIHSLLDLAAKAKEQRLPEHTDFIHGITRIFQEHRSSHDDIKTDNLTSQAFHRIVSSHIFNPLELPPDYLKRGIDSNE